MTYTSRYPYRDWQAPSLDLRYGNNAYMLYPIRKFVTKGREYTNIGYNPVDVPIIRYADVLLMYAEAVWRAHEVPSPEALEYVNQVRRRGFGVDIKTPNEAVDLKMMDGDKFAEALLAERSFELCFEGQRWYDLVRFGKAKLNLLTEKERKVILLYYYEELTLKEISNILEVSESRVSQLHTKALLKMRKKMGSYMGILIE